MGKCKEVDCNIRASFGIKDGKAEYCKTHKNPHMINVNHITCKECDVRACFGIKGENSNTNTICLKGSFILL